MCIFVLSFFSNFLSRFSFPNAAVIAHVLFGGHRTMQLPRGTGRALLKQELYLGQEAAK